MIDVAGYFESYLDYLPLLFIVVWLYWTRMVGGPWVPSSIRNIHKMLELAGVGPDDVVYDLGCGDGRMVLTAAKHYDAKSVGIEIDPLRYIWCQFLITILLQRKNVQIKFGNLFNLDLSGADVVMCYLLPDANRKLEEKFKNELRPGTRIVSNKYPFPTLDLIREDGDVRLYMLNTEHQN